MAKRKLTSLRSVLLRYLLLCGGGCALILVLWWVIFMQLINIGFLLPAVASAQACSEARETVAAAFHAVRRLTHSIPSRSATYAAGPWCRTTRSCERT